MPHPDEAVAQWLRRLGWKKVAGPKTDPLAVLYSPPGVKGAGFSVKELSDFFEKVVVSKARDSCDCQGPAWPCSLKVDKCCAEAKKALAGIHRTLVNAAALSEAVAAMLPGRGDGTISEHAAIRGSSSTYKPKVPSSSPPTPTEDVASSSPNPDVKATQSPPERWKLIDRQERAFWDVFFSMHGHILRDVAIKAKIRNSTPALMRQIAFTTFQTLVKDLVFFGLRKKGYKALGFHRTDKLQTLMEKAVEEIQDSEGVLSAEAMQGWLKDNAPYVFRNDRSAVDPIKPGDEYLFFDAVGTPRPLVCKLGVCQCIRCVCAPALPPTFELELAGLDGCSTLEDFGEAVEDALKKLPGLDMPEGHAWCLLVQYPVLIEGSSGPQVMCWRNSKRQWCRAAVPEVKETQPQLIGQNGNNHFVASGFMMEGTKIEVCMREVGDEKEIGTVPSVKREHDGFAVQFAQAVRKGADDATVSSKKKRRRDEDSAVSALDMGLASSLVEMSRTENEEEHDFLTAVQRVNKSELGLKRRNHGVAIDWLALYNLVWDRGGFDALNALKRGAWAEVAKKLYQGTYNTRDGHVLKEAYRTVLLKYEYEMREREEEEERQRVLADDIIKVEDDGPLPLTLGKGEEGMTITQRFDELLSDMLRLADEKRRQLKVLKKHEGYGEFESVKEKLQLVQRQISEGTSEAPTSVLIYGRNGAGKSTLIQNVLRLGEAPQSLYLKLGKSYEQEAVVFEAVARVEALRADEKDQGEADDTDGDLPARCQIVEPRQETLSQLPELRTKDTVATEALRTYCEGTTRTFQGMEPYLLPTGNVRESTTALCTTLCYGRQYQLLLVYEAEDKIREQLEEYDWLQAARLSNISGGFGDDKARMTYEYMRRLYIAFTGGQKIEGGELGDDNSEMDVDEPFDARSDDDEDDEEVEVFGASSFASARDAGFKDLTAEIYPKRNLVEGELVACPEVKALLGQAFIYVGPGKCVTDDRLYIKETLRDKLKEPQSICLKEVRLFVPCTLLEGNIELVDGPGAEDSDPIKHRNLAEAIARADHIVALVEKDLEAAWGTTELLVKQGVFRRRLQEKLKTGINPVQLSFVLCSEKEERLQGTDLMKEEWVKSFKEGSSQAAAKVQRKLDELLRAAYRDAGKDASRLPSDRSTLITFSYPVLFTSLMLNQTYREQHALTIADMLHRTNGTELLSIIIQQGQRRTEQRCQEVKQYCETMKAQLEELMRENEKPLPPEVCSLARAAWKSRSTSLDGLKGAFQKCEGVVNFEKYSNTGTLSIEMDKLIGRLAGVFETCLNRAYDEIIRGLEAILKDIKPVNNSKKSKQAHKKRVQRAMYQPFSTQAKGRDSEVPWLTIMTSHMLGEQATDVVDLMCQEVDKQIKMFKDSVRETCVGQLRLSLNPRFMAPDAASLVKSRVNGRRGAGQKEALDSSDQSASPFTGTTDAASEALAVLVEEQRKALDDRIEWFTKVRLVDALEGWTYSLPTWRAKSDMLKLIQEVMQKLLVDTVTKVAKPGSKKSGDIKKELAAQLGEVKQKLRPTIEDALHSTWEKKWKSLRIRLTTEHGPLYKIYKDFMTGVANNEVLRSDSTLSLIDLLTRSLTSLELFRKCLKARKSGRAVELCRQLLDRLATYPEGVTELLARAKTHALPPLPGVQSVAESKSHKPLVDAIRQSRSAPSDALLDKHFAHITTEDVDTLLLSLVYAADGLQAGDAFEGIVDGLLPVLVAQIRDMLLTEKRKAAFAERMGGEFKYGDLIALVRPEAGAGKDKQAGVARPFRDCAGYEWACIALIEAFSSKASVPVDIYVSGDRAAQRFRVCEEGKVEEEKALRLAYVEGDWRRPLPSIVPEPSAVTTRDPSPPAKPSGSAAAKGEASQPKRARKDKAPKSGSSGGGGKTRVPAYKAHDKDVEVIEIDDPSEAESSSDEEIIGALSALKSGGSGGMRSAEMGDTRTTDRAQKRPGVATGKRRAAASSVSGSGKKRRLHQND